MKRFFTILFLGFVLGLSFAYRVQIYNFYNDYYNNQKSLNVFEDSENKDPNAIGFEPESQTSDFPYGNIQYVKNSNQIPIAEDMVMTDENEFNNYAHQYNDVLCKSFSLPQVKSIQEIIISDCSGFGDGECGLCSTTTSSSSRGGTKVTSSILIASRHPDHIRSLLHECCHALYFNNLDLFNREFKDRWNNCSGFVTDYAGTNIEEDFAETGSFYLSNSDAGDALEKISLFKEFYLKTKQ